MTTLPERIQALRESREWTIAAAAKRAGIAPSLWTTIEQGEGNPRLRTLGKVAHIFELTIAELLLEVGDEPHTMGQRMRLHRERQGLDQGQAAAASGMPREEWSRLERGAHDNPNWARIQAVSTTLGIHPGELVYGVKMT